MLLAELGADLSGALLLVFCAAGVARLQLSHDPVAWFSPHDSLRIAMEQINRDLNGSMFVEALIETGQENGVQTPELLNRIERTESMAVREVPDAEHGLSDGATR